MPASDAYAWGAAAAAVNAELGDALRVGHGPVPDDGTCRFVDVCPGEAPEVSDGCVARVRYVAGETGAAEAVLWELASGVTP